MWDWSNETRNAIGCTCIHACVYVCMYVCVCTIETRHTSRHDCVGCAKKFLCLSFIFCTTGTQHTSRCDCVGCIKKWSPKLFSICTLWHRTPTCATASCAQANHSHVFFAYRDTAHEHVRRRRVCKKIMSRLSGGCLVRCFHLWHDAVSQTKRSASLLIILS